MDVARTNNNGRLDKNQVHQIKSTYLQLVYHQHLLSLYDSLKNQTARLLSVITLKYNTGEIDELENSRWLTEYYSIENTFDLLCSQQLIFQNNLKKLLLTDRDIMPVEKTIYLYPIDKKNDDYVVFFENLDGYPEDSIAMDTGSFLDFKEKENALLAVVALQNQLTHYENRVLPLAATYEHFAVALLEAEEIDYEEYFMYVSRVFDIKVKYLDLVNQYNQAVLDLEVLLK